MVWNKKIQVMSNRPKVYSLNWKKNQDMSNRLRVYGFK